MRACRAGCAVPVQPRSSVEVTAGPEVRLARLFMLMRCAFHHRAVGCALTMPAGTRIRLELDALISECPWERGKSAVVGYFVVQATIDDEPQFRRYRKAVVPFIASFGGKLAARGAKVEVFEGEHDAPPVVMFEFPDM